MNIYKEHEKPMTQQDYGVYVTVPGKLYYYTARCQSRSICCKVENPCRYHNPNPVIRHEIHTEYLTLKLELAEKRARELKKQHEEAIEALKGARLEYDKYQNKIFCSKLNV